MNYLAHAHLSFKNPGILIGNLIADTVRGKQIMNFPEIVRYGIYLHRQIDHFTDTHEIVRETKRIFYASAGRYDGTFLDIAFDHFLATDQSREPSEGWSDFAQWCYGIVNNNINLLPDRFRRLFRYMEEENWFYNYRYGWMIEDSFVHMVRRASFLEDDLNVYKDFTDNYETIQNGYNSFFPELEAFAKEIASPFL